jgi:hypothetical protein
VCGTFVGEGRDLFGSHSSSVLPLLLLLLLQLPEEIVE